MAKAKQLSYLWIDNKPLKQWRPPTDWQKDYEDAIKELLTEDQK